MEPSSLNPAEAHVGSSIADNQSSEQSKPKRSVTPQAIWDQIRIAYETSRETVAQLAKRYAVSTGAIQYRSRKEGWLPRRIAKGSARPGRQDVLLRRLYRTIDQKLAQLEGRMSHEEDDLSIADHERQTRALGQLIRNFEKVSGLETEQSGGTGQPPGGKSERDSAELATDPERLRNELAERILRLREKRVGKQTGDC
ncbi:MAG: hypothetical protein AAGD43_24695 [Pseudomonadota bacterium]